MKSSEKSGHYDLLMRFYDLPQKILFNNDIDLSPIILHDLSSNESFGFKKVAYLVNNNCFNKLVGISGFSKDEISHKSDIWDALHKNATKISKNKFHTKVRNFESVNVKNKNDIKKVAQTLGMKDCKFFTWEQKHDNTGVILFQEGKPLSKNDKLLFEKMVTILSFCHVDYSKNASKTKTKTKKLSW